VKLIVALLVAVEAVAGAHQASVSYSVAAARGADVDYTLRVSSRDLYEALGLDRDRDATDDEIRAGGDALTRYVTDRLHITDDGAACAWEPRGVDVVDQIDRFAVVKLVAHCPSAGGRLAIQYDLFFDLDPRHVGMLQVGDATTELSRDARRYEWGARGFGAAQWVVKGMEHIYTGYDHICFLIGLLLVAAVRRGERGWEPRDLRAAIPYILQIVTGFTAGHSVTLILAALGVVTLPSRFVESAIAASIVYVAAENIWLGDPGHRWPLAMAFGLVHGLGFASVLRPMLPRTHVVAPLLEFNVGVELGQLTIVLAVLPLLLLFARGAPDRYRRVVVFSGSIAIGLAASFWLIERVIDVHLLGGSLG
jgi:hypothetical protein